MFDWPKNGKLEIPGLTNKVRSATLLEGDKLQTTITGSQLNIAVPVAAPDPVATVIKLELKGKVKNVNTAAKDKMRSGELD